MPGSTRPPGGRPNSLLRAPHAGLWRHGGPGLAVQRHRAGRCQRGAAGRARCGRGRSRNSPVEQLFFLFFYYAEASVGARASARAGQRGENARSGFLDATGTRAPTRRADSVQVIVQTSATALNGAATATSEAVAAAAANVCNGGSAQAAAQAAAKVRRRWGLAASRERLNAPRACSASATSVLTSACAPLPAGHSICDCHGGRQRHRCGRAACCRRPPPSTSLRSAAGGGSRLPLLRPAPPAPACSLPPADGFHPQQVPPTCCCLQSRSSQSARRPAAAAPPPQVCARGPPARGCAELAGSANGSAALQQHCPTRRPLLAPSSACLFEQPRRWPLRWHRPPALPSRRPAAPADRPRLPPARMPFPPTLPLVGGWVGGWAGGRSGFMRAGALIVRCAQGAGACPAGAAAGKRAAGRSTDSDALPTPPGAPAPPCAASVTVSATACAAGGASATASASGESARRQLSSLAGMWRGCLA